MQVQDSARMVDTVDIVPDAGTWQQWDTLDTLVGQSRTSGCIGPPPQLGSGNEVFREDARGGEGE